MVSLRTEAESVARALEVGLLDVADAVVWADRQIERSEVPHAAICDCAMAASRYPRDVASILRQVPGDYDQSQALRLLLRYALDALEQRKRDPRKIAHALFDLACAGDLPKSELKYHSWGYWDAIDLARDGYIHQTEKQVIAHMTSTLKDFLVPQDEWQE